MTIADVMTRTVATCYPEESLHHAAKLMWDYDCGCLPVRDRDGTLTGIVTDRDICMAAFTQGRPIQNVSVSEAMAEEVFSCLPDDSLAEAEEIMRQRRVHRLPVIDASGKVVGLISLNDIARESLRQQARKQKDVTPAEVGATLAAICEPRQPIKIPATG